MYSAAKLQRTMALSDSKLTSIWPLILEPKNSSSLIVPLKIFLSSPLSETLISSGLIVTVETSSLILSLHSKTDPWISIEFEDIFLP